MWFLVRGISWLMFRFWRMFGYSFSSRGSTVWYRGSQLPHSGVLDPGHQSFYLFFFFFQALSKEIKVSVSEPCCCPCGLPHLALICLFLIWFLFFSGRAIWGCLLVPDFLDLRGWTRCYCTWASKHESDTCRRRTEFCRSCAFRSWLNLLNGYLNFFSEGASYSAFQE